MFERQTAHALNREQLVFVMSGRVTLTLNDTDQVITKGDAGTVRSQSPALWVNASEKPVQLLFVATPSKLRASMRHCRDALPCRQLFSATSL